MLKAPWFSMFRICFQAGLQYRSAAISGAVTQIAFGLLFILVYRALYAANPQTPPPLNLAQITTYLWLVQTFLFLVPWRGDTLISQSILTGNVALELLRPTDLYSLWFARVLGGKLSGLLLRILPVLGFGFFFIGLRMPEHNITWILFTTSILASILLCSAIINLFHVLLFWTITAEGLPVLFMAINSAFSGQILPLIFLPPSIKNFLIYLPFAGILDTPFTIFLEKENLTIAIVRIISQFIWIFVLIIAGKYYLQRHLQKLSIAGG